MARIQGQRGVVQSPGGQAAQNDIYALQASILPKTDAWYLSPFQPYDTLQSAPMTANTLHLIYLPDRDRDATMRYARIRVGTTDASGVFYAALYKYDGTSKAFKVLPYSGLSFSQAVTGNVTNKLGDKVIASRDDKLFLGCISTSATASMFGLSWTPWHFGSVLTCTYTTLPTVVTLSQCTKNYTSYVAAVTYLSETAYQVL